MTVHYQGHGVTLHHGDCLDVLRTLPDASVDSVCTDPPYSLTDRREQYCAGDVLRDAIIMDAQHADAERTKSLVTLRITVAPSLAMRVRGVHLDRHVAAGEEEVDDDSAAGRQDDDVLVDEGDAVAGEERLGGLFRLWVRQGVSRCIGACRCLGQHGDGLIRVPVRLRHDALDEAEGSPGIMALGGAELAAVLALDVARLTGELLPASGADALDQPFELLCPEEVGAGAGARRLASVTEAGGVGGVGDSADRALSFDLVAHRAILSWRPTVLRGFMSSLWDGTGVETDTRLWRECLRVLKPGGHCLAFGSPRTWHNLQTAIERSGFEVRDGIAWLSGSGFPKSLDVSKAIDKRANVNDETHRRIALVAEVIRTHREAKGMERSAVSLAVVGTPSGACWNWEHQQLPSAEMWPAIKRALDIPDKFDGLIEGTRAQFIGAEREVIGERTTGLGTGRGAVAYIGDSDNRDVTAPATPAAARWQGWGTALKPSFEGIVCATKPVPALARIGSRLDELEQSCRPPASGAVPSSAPTHPDSLGARTASAPASAATRREDEPARTTPTGAAGGSSAATATSASELTGATFWNTVTSWKACWAELCEATSTSTTGTTSSTTTDLETLWCCLSQITPESTTTDPTSPDGLSSFVGAVDAMFAAAVLNSRATRTLTAIGSATSGTPPTSPAAGGSRAAFEPVVVARKPLAGTVAANVLAHGTGALNIDGCRIGDGADRTNGGATGKRVDPDEGYMGSWSAASDGLARPTGGRWPANVVLDPECATLLDEQSGTLTSGLMRAGTKPKGERETYGQDAAAGYETTRDTPTDSGGASRFFYVAKADASERPRVNGTAHPTVKPLALMRWLVRLVTPPGGTVLEPFAGSGTTVEACIVEGFQCIAIEREADYLPLIRQRIDRRRDPVEALRGQAADLGLFDLLGGEGA